MIHPDLIQCSIALAYNAPRTQEPLYPPSDTQSPISNEEFYFYYRGIPSNPLLVARSSARHTAWVAPTGPEAYPQRKELRSVGTKHKLNELWEDHLAKGFLELLEEEHVDWTSVDVLRIVDEGQPTHSKPPIIWVGVVPDSLDTVRGLEVALKCKAYLPEELDDVEVEFRESVVNFLGGSSSESNVDPSERKEKHQAAQEKQPFRFLTPPSMIDSSGELRRSLTATLGQSIAAQSTSWSDCTGSFFVSLPKLTSVADPEVQLEVGDSSATTDTSTCSSTGTDRRIFLVSARHALLPLNVRGNETCDYDASSNGFSNPHNKQENVLLLGDTSFAQYLGEIQEGITDVAVTIKVKQHNLERLQRDSSSSAKDPDRLRRDDEKRNEALKRTEGELVMLHRSLEKHTKYFQFVLKNYSRSSSRVFGHIAYSPPLSLSSSESMSKEHHTTDHTPFLLDYALIELSPSTLSTLTKENFFAFGGNVIHLHSSSSTSLGSTDFGSELSFFDVGMMLDPVRAHRWQEPQKKNKEGRSFDYPIGGLMTVGTEVIGVREMRRPVRLEVGGGGAEDKAEPEEKEEKDKLDEVGDKVDVDEDKNGVDDSAEEEDPSYSAYMAEYKLKEELRKKYAAEDADDPDVMVLKRGHATGLTIGRAGTIFSYIRHTEKHMPLGSHTSSTIAATATAAASSSSAPSDPASAPSSAKPLVSKAWPILSYGTYPYKPFHNRGRLPPPFASHGDSGALVVDVLGEKLVSSSWYAGSTGRLGGILTSGAGAPDRRPIRWGDVRGMFGECDVAYALPVEVLLRDLVGRAEGRFGKVEVGVGVRPE
ncbi:hypothetical protein CVT26_008587 [Gymnopilus dilepis]|uniref:Uncharacterized protein n=1 Tax=Gymnopilus dilepis TaxID=231916 RepID=A0A409XXS4_9AGAR|nr:hypothetical protein CVT26_008587 [Gymnopilus dilepis]